MQIITFNPTILKNLFNSKVRESCKSCKRYGKNANCPPYIETLNYYKQLLPSYQKGILIYKQFQIDNSDKWVSIGKESSLEIHKKLLQCREKLQNEGHYYILLLGAGSCKLCEKCQIPCINPSKSITPIEATGIDLVKFMKPFEINIQFPVKTTFYRIGMVLYD